MTPGDERYHHICDALDISEDVIRLVLGRVGEASGVVGFDCRSEQLSTRSYLIIGSIAFVRSHEIFSHHSGQTPNGTPTRPLSVVAPLPRWFIKRASKFVNALTAQICGLSWTSSVRDVGMRNSC